MGVAFNDRKSLILEQVRKNEKVTVAELTSLLRVSQVTIRRDLQQLEQEGRVVKTYGGAVSTDKVAFEFSFRKKLQRNMSEKQHIGQYAAGLVRDGEAIFLDNGTTTLQIAYNLKMRRNIKVVTNSLCVVYVLESAERIELILLGGIVRRGWNDLYGPITEKAIAGLHVDKAFIGTEGISLKAGFTTADVRTTRPIEMVIRSAKEVIVVADHTKIDQAAFTRFASFEDVDILVTSQGIGEKEKKELRERGLKVIVV